MAGRLMLTMELSSVAMKTPMAMMLKTVHLLGWPKPALVYVSAAAISWVDRPLCPRAVSGCAISATSPLSLPHTVLSSYSIVQEPSRMLHLAPKERPSGAEVRKREGG